MKPNVDEVEAMRATPFSLSRPPLPPREEVLTLGAALVTVTLWASAFVGIRSAGRDLSPGALSLGRLLVGSFALGLIVLARREPIPNWRDLRGIALCGVLWFGIYNVTLNAAEQRVDAGTAAMLVNVGPILIAVLAGVLLREGFPRRLIAGCTVAFGGVALIALGTSGQGISAGWGAVLCIIAAFAYAGGVVTQKPLLARVSALQLTWLACTAGALACLPFAAALFREIPAARPSAIGWTIYLGALPTAVAFTTWAYALTRTTAGRMGSTTYLVPPIAIVMGWLLLGETPSIVALVGGVACLSGVVIARRSRRSR
jgi:drug/metabolite transporter (DMT)-like permease